MCRVGKTPSHSVALPIREHVSDAARRMIKSARPAIGVHRAKALAKAAFRNVDLDLMGKVAVNLAFRSCAFVADHLSRLCPRMRT